MVSKKVEVLYFLYFSCLRNMHRLKKQRETGYAWEATSFTVVIGDGKEKNSHLVGFHGWISTLVYLLTSEPRSIMICH